MRKITLLIAVVSLLFAACEKKQAQDEGAEKAAGKPAAKAAAPGEDSGAMFSGYDAQAEQKVLQGTWEVKDTSNTSSTWVVEGDEVTRKTEKGEEKGKLEFPFPGKVVLAQEKGGGTQRSYYGYARNGSEVYLGLGKAGVKLGDRYLVAADGMVVKAGEKCKYYEQKMFKGFKKEGIDIKCSITKDGEKQILVYEIPDRFKKGKMREAKVNIVGTALLDQQMMGNKATKK